jgi:tetratricopeptide (TPR) repeat protein
VKQRQAFEPLPAISDTPEGLVLALEAASGRERTSLLKSGRERFRGRLFNALLERARASRSGGGVDEPKALLQRAARIALFAVNSYAQGKCFFAIGEVWHDFGHFEQAVTAYRRAADLFQRVGVPDGAVSVLASCGQALIALGKGRAATRCYHRARRLAEFVNGVQLAAQINNNLGNAYRRAGDFRRARSVFLQALSGARIVISSSATVIILADRNTCYRPDSVVS